LVITNNGSSQEEWKTGFRKLNVAIKKHPYPLYFIIEVLNIVVGHGACSLLDGYFIVITIYL
jgi:hypothetical protein